MGVGKVIFIPILVMTLIIATVYLAAFSLESTDESRVTEISASLEANFNEIARQTLVAHLDKDAMGQGFLFVKDQTALRQDLMNRLNDYIANNYIHGGQLYLNLGRDLRPGNAQVHGIMENNEDLNNLQNFNVIVEINPGTNPDTAAVNNAYSSLPKGTVGNAYSAQYNSAAVDQETFPSIAIYGDREISIPSHRGDSVNPTILNPQPAGEDRKIVGFFTSFIRNTGGNNLYPVSFTCHVTAESYSDNTNIKTVNAEGKLNLTTRNDNRAKYANVAYTINQSANPVPNTATYNQNKNEAKNAFGSTDPKRDANFDEKSADKQSSTVGSNGGFAVGLDLDKNATINGSKIDATQSGVDKAQNAYQMYTGTKW